ncbi:uncharacterized protein LOC121505062 [Cheilinus undulatus]|uniref:uncharacterized protein LOC121505062 n=1 Tax=Cheilinus undulatus TaxID=241271 RepID=UPI001BD6336C|nr:uncharacterized protein LOC121505062 [Cheilinus undulatus]XP_041636124.1 uncharacterized protein LOC121505062 [Cheilinus undulatus]
MEAVGQMPWGRFVTTYSSDYNPLRSHHLQVNQQRPIADVRTSPPTFLPPQTGSEICPTFYTTTNSVYGSFSHLQSPSYSLSPVSFPQFGLLAPPTSEASAALTGARIQEPGVAGENCSVLGEVEKGQPSIVLKNQGAKDDQQQKTDDPYEEGVIVLPSFVCPACCEDRIRSVCREARLHPLILPVASEPMVRLIDAEYWDASIDLKGLVASGLKNCSYLQPYPRQCSCCVCTKRFPCNYSFQMQTSSSCCTHLASNVNCRERTRGPLTEYQASYTCKWAQTQIQQSGFHHLYLPNQQSIFYVL